MKQGLIALLSLVVGGALVVLFFFSRSFQSIAEERLEEERSLEAAMRPALKSFCALQPGLTVSELPFDGGAPVGAFDWALPDGGTIAATEPWPATFDTAFEPYWSHPPGVPRFPLWARAEPLTRAPHPELGASEDLGVLELTGNREAALSNRFALSLLSPFAPEPIRNEAWACARHFCAGFTRAIGWAVIHHKGLTEDEVAWVEARLAERRCKHGVADDLWKRRSQLSLEPFADAGQPGVEKLLTAPALRLASLKEVRWLAEQAERHRADAGL